MTVAVGLMSVFSACSGVAGDGRFDFEEDSGSGLSPNMGYEFAFVEIDGLFFEPAVTACAGGQTLTVA